MQREYKQRSASSASGLSVLELCAPEMRSKAGNYLPVDTAQYVGRLASSKITTGFLFKRLSDDELPEAVPRLRIILDRAVSSLSCIIS